MEEYSNPWGETDELGAIVSAALDQDLAELKAKKARADESAVMGADSETSPPGSGVLVDDGAGMVAKRACNSATWRWDSNS